MRITVHNGLAGMRERSPAAKIFPTLFFGVFLAAGLWMSWYMVRGLWQTAGRYRWQEAPCTFTSSDWSENADASSSERYSGRAAYRYEWSGSEYHGEASETFGAVGDAQRFRDQHAAGAGSTCFVNPEAPQESALRRPSPWTFLVLLFPMTFVATGAIPIILIWKPRREQEEAPARQEALTKKGGSNAAAGCVMVGFFLVFLAAGAAVMWFVMGRALMRVGEAKSWTATPCTVLASEVVTHAGDDGNTYSALVRYSYLFGGREYQSDRYDFSTGSTSNFEAHQQAVERFVVGSSCTCFVDPSDPTRAVLDRGFRKGYLIGLFGLPFFAVGLGGLIFLARAGLKKTQAAAPGTLRARPAMAAAGVGPLRLRSQSGPWKKFLGSLAVNFFWNGIVGVFIFVIARDWRAGNGEWFPILILTPFALIGLLLLSALPHAFLGLFNPRPVLELDRSECAPGESVSGRFRLSGLLGRIERLEITLEGKEAATLTTRSGGKSSTSRQEKMFHRSIVYESGPGAAPEREAEISVQVPADTMHSFSSANNEVRWLLHARIEIRRWPDIDEQFAFQVPPKRSWR